MLGSLFFQGVLRLHLAEGKNADCCKLLMQHPY